LYEVLGVPVVMEAMLVDVTIVALVLPFSVRIAGV
jgi:hypothetical protein